MSVCGRADARDLLFSGESGFFQAVSDGLTGFAGQLPACEKSVELLRRITMLPREAVWLRRF
jgi:hypothetical protein